MQLTLNQRIVGSSPTGGTNYPGVGKSGNPRDLGSRNRKFESCHLDHLLFVGAHVPLAATDTCNVGVEGSTPSVSTKSSRIGD